MKMKYFILYTLNEKNIHEVYLKGRSMEHMEERIK